MRPSITNAPTMPTDVMAAVTPKASGAGRHHEYADALGTPGARQPRRRTPGRAASAGIASTNCALQGDLVAPRDTADRAAAAQAPARVGDDEHDQRAATRDSERAHQGQPPRGPDSRPRTSMPTIMPSGCAASSQPVAVSPPCVIRVTNGAASASGTSRIAAPHQARSSKRARFGAAEGDPEALAGVGPERGTAPGRARRGRAVAAPNRRSGRPPAGRTAASTPKAARAPSAQRRGRRRARIR